MCTKVTFDLDEMSSKQKDQVLFLRIGSIGSSLRWSQIVWASNFRGFA